MKMKPHQPTWQLVAACDMPNMCHQWDPTKAPQGRGLQGSNWTKYISPWAQLGFCKKCWPKNSISLAPRQRLQLEDFADHLDKWHVVTCSIWYMMIYGCFLSQCKTPGSLHILHGLYGLFSCFSDFYHPFFLTSSRPWPLRPQFSLATPVGGGMWFKIWNRDGEWRWYLESAHQCRQV